MGILGEKILAKGKGESRKTYTILSSDRASGSGPPRCQLEGDADRSQAVGNADHPPNGSAWTSLWDLCLFRDQHPKSPHGHFIHCKAAYYSTLERERCHGFLAERLSGKGGGVTK